MAIAISALNIHWQCKHTWRRASYNTSWCLLGCAIGDRGTILYFQVTGIEWPVLWIMSLISMVSMKAAMNLTDFLLTGGAMLTWWAVPLMLVAGFVTPLPYNYWRLNALGKACH